MKVRQGHKSIVLLALFTALFFINIIPSHADTLNYTYDAGNRLIRIENPLKEQSIDYQYDDTGNLTVKSINTKDATGPVTTATPPGGTYTTPQTITLTCTDGSGYGCDKIYYTTDGSTPNISSPVYSSAITIAITTTLKFFAKDIVGNAEATKSETYTILDIAPPETTATPPGGTYGAPQSVILACNDSTGYGCDKIYYTTDGSTPTTSSPVYSSTIAIAATTLLKFFA